MRLLLAAAALAALPAAASAQGSTDGLTQQRIEIGRLIQTSSVFRDANWQGDRTFVDLALTGPNGGRLLAMGRCIVGAAPERAAAFAAGRRGTQGLRPVFDRCGSTGLSGGYQARTAMRRAIVQRVLAAPAPVAG